MRSYATSIRDDEPDATVDVELERSNVARALEDYQWFIDSRLSPDFFVSSDCRQILELAGSLHEQGKPVSIEDVGCEFMRVRGPGKHNADFNNRLLDHFRRPTVPPNPDMQRENARLYQLRQGLLHAVAKVERGEIERALDDTEEAVSTARATIDASSGAVPARTPFIWRTTAEIFEPLPETKWLVQGLQVGPGRPSLIAGYGASAKTLSAQSLALAVASGTYAWGHFDTAAGEVRHLDYEQGFHATARRYQRLALGHGIDPARLGDRLKVAVFPSVYLDSPDAVDAYSRVCEGASLVILDALRGATPTRDENDSSIKSCLDNLSRVSEKTGTAFVLLHHAGKPKDGHSDPRTILRGSSAIFDACGCILVVTAGKTKDDPRKVSQVKQAAEAEGGGMDDFTLSVEDVEVGGNPTAGVRVMYRPLEVENTFAQADAKYERDAARLLELVRTSPGATQAAIVAKAGMKKSTAIDTLNALVDEGRLMVEPGANRAKMYRVGDSP